MRLPWAASGFSGQNSIHSDTLDLGNTAHGWHRSGKQKRPGGCRTRHNVEVVSAIKQLILRGIVTGRFHAVWGRSSVWLERCPVTAEVAGSSPVVPAIDSKRFRFNWHPL